MGSAGAWGAGGGEGGGGVGVKGGACYVLEPQRPHCLCAALRSAHRPIGEHAQLTPPQGRVVIAAPAVLVHGEEQDGRAAALAAAAAPRHRHARRRLARLAHAAKVGKRKQAVEGLGAAHDAVHERRLVRAGGHGRGRRRREQRRHGCVGGCSGCAGVVASAGAAVARGGAGGRRVQRARCAAFRARCPRFGAQLARGCGGWLEGTRCAAFRPAAGAQRFGTQVASRGLREGAAAVRRRESRARRARVVAARARSLRVVRGCDGGETLWERLSGVGACHPEVRLRQRAARDASHSLARCQAAGVAHAPRPPLLGAGRAGPSPPWLARPPLPPPSLPPRPRPRTHARAREPRRPRKPA